MPKISFNNSQTPFFSYIKERVNNYFAENDLQKSGEKKLYIKSGILISSAGLIYTILMFFNPGITISIMLCLLLGMNIAMIGFNVMHEGGHQTLSKYKWINTASAYFLNLLGANSYFWKIKHNINHHTYTNIEGMDLDIDIKPFMRLHENQSHYWIHKFQHFYCLILYGISYFNWIFIDDFIKYFNGKIAEGNVKKMIVREHFIFWITKSFYLVSFIAVPIYVLGALQALIGFAIVSFTCGLFIAIVFQLAHVVEGTSFTSASSEAQKIEQEWAIHQLCTTANFSTGNKIICWMLGGLNFQVEHHLFPRISHVHYPKINEFVKEACEKYEVTYLEYSTMLKAISSHFTHIKKMGKAL